MGKAYVEVEDGYLKKALLALWHLPLSVKEPGACQEVGEIWALPQDFVIDRYAARPAAVTSLLCILKAQ